MKLYVRTDGNDGNDGSSWELAKKTITNAVNSASSDDEIWVADGRYDEIVSLEKNLCMYTKKRAEITGINATDFKGSINGFYVGSDIKISRSSCVLNDCVLDKMHVNNATIILQQVKCVSVIAFDSQLCILRCDCQFINTFDCHGVIHATKVGNIETNKSKLVVFCNFADEFSSVSGDRSIFLSNVGHYWLENSQAIVDNRYDEYINDSDYIHNPIRI